MKRQDAVTRIRTRRDKLAALRVSLFGSAARDAGHELSDVDVIIDTDDAHCSEVARRHFYPCPEA